MLAQLTINDFTIVDHLDLELYKGMTVITGETGAGKSIMLDAIGLALGDRADSKCVRMGAKRADICVQFDIGKYPIAQKWLQEHDLDDDKQCILRRVITKEGRSRGYINHQSVPLQTLRQLGGLLIDIHNQHQHQSLLKKETPRRLLDNFAQHQDLATQVKHAYKTWHRTQQQLLKRQNQSDELQAKKQLLTYQLDELDALNLEKGEIERLEMQQSQLSQGESLLTAAHQALELTSQESGTESNAQQMINQAIQQLTLVENQILPSTKTSQSSNEEELEEEPNDTLSSPLNDGLQLLKDALVYIEESSQALHRFIEDSPINPEKLLEVENRLTAIYDCARKHRIKPLELVEFTESLRLELESMDSPEHNIEELSHLLETYEAEYLSLALQLSKQRKEAAETLSTAIVDELKDLGMPNCQFFVAVKPFEGNHFTSHGIEDIEFLACTNPGQPAQSIQKIASGGELSRISLAIQVITAQTSQIPTMIFDEVDVGIGGATAEKVGQLLKKLGAKGQIICVTHQPQVAAHGDQHLKVEKSNQHPIKTSINYLKAKTKKEEVARMLGGIVITKHTLSHAAEMLSTAKAS